MKVILVIQYFLKGSLQTLESILRVLLLSKPFKKITTKENCKAVAILANGPSLTKDIERYGEIIADCDLLCVNHFPTTELFEKLQPAYYVTSVTELWLQDVDQKYVQQREALLKSFVTKTTWPLTIFLPFESRMSPDWKKELSKNNNITIHYFNNVPIEGFKGFMHFMFNKNLGMPRPQNVLLPSLMMALALQYPTIYLLGVDHSWLPEITVNQNNDVLLNQKHFYDEQTSKHQPMDFKGKGKRTLAEVLHKFMHAFAGYHIVRDYADRRGTRIINCTEKSFIDAFERYSFSNASISEG